MTFRTAGDEVPAPEALVSVGDMVAIRHGHEEIAWGRVQGYRHGHRVGPAVYADEIYDLVIWTADGVTDLEQLAKKRGCSKAILYLKPKLRHEKSGRHPFRKAGELTCTACGARHGLYHTIGCPEDRWIEPPPPGIAESDAGPYVPQIGDHVSYVSRVRGGVGSLVTTRVLAVNETNQRAKVQGVGNETCDPWIAWSALMPADRAS
jgi:hypothetical protein